VVPALQLQSLAWGSLVVSAFAFALGATLCALDRRSEARSDRDSHVLRARDLSAAPRALRVPMRAAADAAETIRRSRAFTDGWLTDVDLDAALWDLAAHVKLGAKLQTLIAEFTDADQRQHPAAIVEAQIALRGAIDHVGHGAERLAAITKQIDEVSGGSDHLAGTDENPHHLDEQTARRPRRAAPVAEHDRWAAESADRAARLPETCSGLQRIDPALDDVADTITVRLDSYAEQLMDPEPSNTPTTR
jgi:hypothetical protein